MFCEGTSLRFRLSTTIVPRLTDIPLGRVRLAREGILSSPAHSGFSVSPSRRSKAPRFQRFRNGGIHPPVPRVEQVDFVQKGPSVILNAYGLLH